MEVYIVQFVGGLLDGQEKEVLTEVVAETLGAEELNEFAWIYQVSTRGSVVEKWSSIC